MKSKLIEQARETERGNGVILEILKGIFVFLVTGIITAIPIAFIMLLGMEDNNTITLITLYFDLVTIILIILYCSIFEKRPISTVGFIKEGCAKQYLKGLLVGFIMFASVIGLGSLVGAYKFAGFKSDTSIISLFLYFGGFVFQGMFEEVLCRGYMMISIARKNSVPMAIFANSLFFMLLHTSNPGFNVLPAINLMLFGIFTSLYMLKTNNIWGVGAIHTIWNFAQGNIFGLNVSGLDKMPTLFSFESTGLELVNGGSFGPEGGFLVTIVMVFGIALLCKPNKRIHEDNKENTTH